MHNAKTQAIFIIRKSQSYWELLLFAPHLGLTACLSQKLKPNLKPRLCQ